jgi:hypothetical protein
MAGKFVECVCGAHIVIAGQGMKPDEVAIVTTSGASTDADGRRRGVVSVTTGKSFEPLPYGLNLSPRLAES